jgi:hypothetical protein
MMHQLWRKHTIDEVNEGRCGPQMHRCLNAVIIELGQMSEREMQEHITIRMTKATQDSIQDSNLIQYTLAGLIAFVCQDLRDEWYHQPARPVHRLRDLNKRPHD